MGKNTNGQNIKTQQHNTTQHDKIFLEPTARQNIFGTDRASKYFWNLSRVKIFFERTYFWNRPRVNIFFEPTETTEPTARQNIF